MKLVRIYIGYPLYPAYDRRTDEVATTLFGGFTRYEAVGGWKPMGKSPVVEPATVYEIAFRYWNDKDKTALHSFVQYVGRLCGQNFILVAHQEVELQEVSIDDSSGY